MGETPHFLDELVEALTRAGLSWDFAELHGGLCGSLCARGSPGGHAWIEGWLREFDGTPEMRRALRDQLNRLELDTWASLSGPGFSFEPLLPPDGAPLEQRVDGLATWCHGFLSGLGIAGFTVADGNDGEASPQEETTLTEIVTDFSEISRAGVDAIEDADRDEAGFHFAELIEHVRVGVQLTFDTLAERRREADSKTLH